MKKLINGFMISALACFSLASCLKSVNTNVNDIYFTDNFVQLEYVKDSGQTTINSGMQYFGGGTILFPPSHTVDTIFYQVTYNGATPAPADVTITLGADWSAMADNFANDAIVYDKLPDSTFNLVTPTVTIKAGTRVAYAKFVVYPSKIDPSKSYMYPLAPTVTGTNVSKNFGKLYLHTIGNPMAGPYTWDFYRYPTLTSTYPTGYDGASFFGRSATALPVNPKIFSVPTGYYTQPNYLVSFTNTGGVLTNFKAVIDPAMVPAYFTAGNVSIVQNPVITVSSDYKKITLNYVAFNGSAYRNCWDVFTKK